MVDSSSFGHFIDKMTAVCAVLVLVAKLPKKVCKLIAELINSLVKVHVLDKNAISLIFAHLLSKL